MQKSNLGLSILKTFMSFCVVLAHFWSDQSHSRVLLPFRLLVGYAVPVFMIMSFFLTYNGFLRKDIQYVKKRMERLILPQIGWAGVYWGVSWLFALLCNRGVTIGIKDVMWQILTGHSLNINSAMWFQAVLILITLLFAGIFMLFSEKGGVRCICIVLCLAVGAQYSEINYNLFSELRYELSFPLGRIAEMIPCAVVGFLIAYYGILEKCKKHRGGSIFILLLLGVIFLKISIFEAPVGFYYSGVKSILIAANLVAIAFLLPLEFVPERVEKIIGVMCRYTLGVYCMHNLVGREIAAIFNKLGLESGTFFMCCIIYLICYIIAFGISKIPAKLCKQLVE